MEALAAAYSSGVRTVFNSRYSVSHAAFVSSNASARPPQPTYRDNISCSSGVALRFSSSHFFKSWIAMILARNFSFGVPCPSSSSVMRKFTAKISVTISSVGSTSSTDSGCSTVSDASPSSDCISSCSTSVCSTSSTCCASSRSAILCASCRSSYFSSSSGDK